MTEIDLSTTETTLLYEPIPPTEVYAELGRLAQLTQEWGRRGAAAALGISALTGCTATGSQTTGQMIPNKAEKVIAIDHRANTMTTGSCTQESQKINGETRYYPRCNPTIGHLKEQTAKQVRAAGGGTHSYSGGETANCSHPSNDFIDSLSLGDVFKMTEKKTQKLTDRGGRTGDPITICTWDKQ